MMKVENIQLVKNIPDKLLPQLLRQGDFVMSEVIKVEDGTALLRTAQGMLLSAHLLGELGLMAGDHVETVVDEAGQGRYVLRLLDIAHGETVMPEPGQAETAATQNLKSQTLYSTLNILKKNAGLEPKAAEFMARNGITATPENIGTLTRLADGGPRVAQVLTQMMVDAQLSAGVERAATEVGIQPLPTGTTEAWLAGQSGYNVPGAEAGPSGSSRQAAMQVPANTTTTTTLMSPAVSVPEAASSTIFPGEAETIMPEGLQPNADELIGSALPRAAPDGTQAPKPVVQDDVQTARPEAKLQTDVQATRLDDGMVSKSMEKLKPDGTIAMEPSAVLLKDGIQEPLTVIRRLVGLFADLNEKETMPAQLKQAAHELPAQLKELKNSLQNADNMDRNILGQRAESLDRQFSMMADIKRFDCYHVPLMSANGQPSTAELYVYRQRRRKREEAPDNYAVLIGVDTQNMGRVETMIRAQGSSVSLEFKLEQPSLADMFEENVKNLAPLIVQAGYQLGDVSVRGMEAKTTVLTAEEALTEGQAADIGGVDIRV
jgi:hypothetical protein